MAFVDVAALWDAHPVLVVLGSVFLALLVVLVLRPGLLLYVPLWLLCHSLYRLRVVGRQHVPAQGPGLLVCNHVTYLDWLFLLMAQRRHVRFVIFAGWTKVWGLRRLLTWGGVIPIDKSAGPRAIVQSLRQAGEALQRGQLVCIFAEGRFTRTGFLLPFHRGFEQIMKHCPEAPIIPVCLEQAWGSIFSFWRGKLIWKLPQEVPYPVTVAFGEALPATARAAEVRGAVQRLSADCAMERRAGLRPAHRQFVRIASRWRYMFRSAVIDPALGKDSRLSYGRLLARAMHLARWLRPHVAKEPQVGIAAPAGAGAALANLALALLGKPTVNLDCADESARFRAIRAARLRVVLGTKSASVSLPSEVRPLAVEDAAPSLWQRLRTRLAILVLPKFVLERWVLGLGGHVSGDLATVIFTSGTTGAPKGVMLSHGNIAANCESLIQVVNASPRDRLLGVLPFSHSFGYTLTFWLPLQIGASVVYQADPSDARQTGDLCKSHRCSILLATPEQLEGCRAVCGSDDFRSLRVLWCGSDKLSGALAQGFESKFGILPLEGYGATELSPAAAVNVPDVDLAGFKQVGHKPGTVGQPLPGVAARVVDPATGATLPAGEEGLLHFYGPNVMLGYLDNLEATRAAVKDGWYNTGDLGRIDEDGFVSVTGRAVPNAQAASHLEAEPDAQATDS